MNKAWKLYTEPKRILVTGGAGFLGSHLCDRPAYGFLYLKRRPLAERFSNTNTYVSMENTAGHISDDEEKRIGDVARAMGLD